MIAANRDDCFPSDGCGPVAPANRWADRIRVYFGQHPKLTREDFLLEAVGREIHFREQTETETGNWIALREGRGSTRWTAVESPPSTEEVRLHASLAERLAALQHERYGQWPRLRRFLFGNRLMRWMGLNGPSAT